MGKMKFDVKQLTQVAPFAAAGVAGFSAAAYGGNMVTFRDERIKGAGILLAGIVLAGFGIKNIKKTSGQMLVGFGIGVSANGGVRVINAFKPGTIAISGNSQISGNAAKYITINAQPAGKSYPVSGAQISGSQISGSTTANGYRDAGYGM